MPRVCRINGYFLRLFRKTGFIKIGILLLFVSTFLLLCLRSYTRLTNRKYPIKFQLRHVEEYCNEPRSVNGEENKQIKGYTLTQLQMFIRHGDRAPVDPQAIPNIIPLYVQCSFNESSGLQRMKLEEYKRIIKKNNIKTKGTLKTSLLKEQTFCLAGQLTPRGYLQHIYNGEHFREVYKKFISHIRLNTEVLVQSTDVPRTIQSSSALLVSLFLDDFLTGDNFEVLIHVYRDERSAHMLLDQNKNILSCPGLHALTKFNSTSLFKTFQANVHHLEQTLANILSITTQSLPSFGRVADIFYTKLCHDHEVPRASRSVIPHSLVKELLLFSRKYSEAIHFPFAEHQALSLLSQTAMNSLGSLTNEDEYKKLVIYSGHDSMLAPLLIVINGDINWPPYASKLVFEIFQDDNYHEKMSLKEKINSTYFRIYYNGVLVKKIKFCRQKISENGLCPLNSLYHYVSDGLYTEHTGNLDQSTLNEILFTRIKKLCAV